MTTFYGDGRVIGYMENITFVQNTLSPAAHFVGDYDQTNTFNKIKKNVTNCPNCGAPLHNNKCVYCGTER